MLIYYADTTKTINFNSAYVGITRGKESVHVYTDDKANLFERIKQEQMKTTTLDYNIDQIRVETKERLIDIIKSMLSVKDGFDITANQALQNTLQIEKDMDRQIKKNNVNPELTP